MRDGRRLVIPFFFISNATLVVFLFAWGVMSSKSAAEWQYESQMLLLHYQELEKQHRVVLKECQSVGDTVKEWQDAQKTFCPPCSKQVPLRYPIDSFIDNVPEPGAIPVAPKPRRTFSPKPGDTLPLLMK